VSDVAPSIFVIEDERAFVEVYDEVLEFGGFQLSDWAFSGEEAVEKYRKRIKDPDLIIMDHRLPGMNGVETMLQILQMNPSAKVLFISADEKAKRPALDKGAVGFLLKPFSLADFIKAVEGGISGKAKPSQSTPK
jgi:CheY-like chemotaxis protein